MGGSSESVSIEGNQVNPHGIIKIFYCGGWGYMSQCKILISQIEEIAQNKFMFYLDRDPQTSGNFEVTLFKSELDFNSLKNG